MSEFDPHLPARPPAVSPASPSPAPASTPASPGPTALRSTAFPAAASAPAIPALSPAAASAPAMVARFVSAEDSASALTMPPQLRAFVTELEQWAASNAQDARHDTLRFWSLKIPAGLSSASASVLALAHLNGIAAVLGTVATACILIDAVNPGGQLRNAHLRAVHDLRDLEHHVVNEWRVADLRGKGDNLSAAEILQSAQKARDKVAADLRGAETSFARTVKTK
jgi:hypothetical protein